MEQMKKPLVSVLMGAYQIEGLSLFPVMMEALLKQSYTNLEILICNDGSTDATGAILEDWAKRDPRISILTHSKNQGLAASLNDCMKQAKGIYFARQDADDLSHPTRIEKQVNFLESYPEIDFIGTNIQLFDETGIWGARTMPEMPTSEDFLFCSPFIHGTVIFRGEALRKAEGYAVNPRTYRTEDYDLFMRMYAMGMQGANLQDTLYDYREDAQNMSKRKYRYRVDEAVVRYKGFRRLGLLPKGFPYVVKPLLVGLLPSRFLFWLKCKVHILKKSR